MTSNTAGPQLHTNDKLELNPIVLRVKLAEIREYVPLKIPKEQLARYRFALAPLSIKHSDLPIV